MDRQLLFIWVGVLVMGSWPWSGVRRQPPQDVRAAAWQRNGCAPAIPALRKAPERAAPRVVRRVQIEAVMQTTLGQLIALLYDAFEHQYHDEKLAALATEAVINDVLIASAPRRTRLAPGNHHRRFAFGRAA